LRNHGYEFGPFRLDVGERLLLRDGESVPLTPKAFDLLLALVERHGRLVDKEELFQWRDRIWMIAASGLALALLALGAAYFKRLAPDARAVRLSFTPPENLTFDNGLYDYVIVSPDGQKLLFTGRSADGKRQLYVRLLIGTLVGDATPVSVSLNWTEGLKK